jgi:hypothetical protein
LIVGPREETIPRLAGRPVGREDTVSGREDTVSQKEDTVSRREDTVSHINGLAIRREQATQTVDRNE